MFHMKHLGGVAVAPIGVIDKQLPGEDALVPDFPVSVFGFLLVELENPRPHDAGVPETVRAFVIDVCLVKRAFDVLFELEGGALLGEVASAGQKGGLGAVFADSAGYGVND